MTTLAPRSETAGSQLVAWLNRLSLAHLLLGGIGLAAAVLRLTALGGTPLAPAEAEQTLLVWRFWQPGGAPLLSADFSPAYFNLTALLTPVLGYGDGVMRLAPALFGLGLVGLPWLIRDRIGVIGALVTSLLLAASPTAAAVARSAGGSAIAQFAALLLLVAWLRYDAGGRPGWFYLAVAGIALGVASAPLFYTSLTALGVAWLIQRYAGPAVLGDRRPDRYTLRQGILAGAAMFGVAGLLFMWNPLGAGAAAGQFGDWLGQFGLPQGLAGWIAPILALGRYELGLLTLGLIAVAWSTWVGRPFPQFCVYWLTAGLLLLLAQPGARDNLLLVTLPGYLLIGQLAEALAERGWRPAAWPATGAVILAGGILYFQTGRYIRLASAGSDTTYYLYVMLLVLAAVGIAYDFLSAGGRRYPFLPEGDAAAARQGLFFGSLIVLLFFSYGTAWWLSHTAANDTRERWVALASDDELPILVRTVRDISQQVRNADHGLQIESSVDSPVLRWYFRDFPRFNIGHTVRPGVAHEAVITPAGAEPRLEGQYYRAEFGLLRTGLIRPETTPPASGLEILRWWLLRQSPNLVAEERVALWIRADLAP